MTFKDYITEQSMNENWFAKLKNKFKNFGYEDSKPGDTFFEWNKKGTERFPSKLITIISQDKGNDIIKFKTEDNNGKLNESSMTFQEWFSDKNYVTRADWIGEEKGSGELAWRLKLTNRKSEFLVTISKWSKLKGKGSNIELNEDTNFYLPINKTLFDLSEIFVYTDMNFDKKTKFSVSTFNIKNYR